MKIPPEKGGCWFCLSDKGTLLYDTEFDTFVHEKCLREKLAEGDMEAKWMSYLIDEDYWTKFVREVQNSIDPNDDLAF